jgi:hypothetical protein
MHLNLVALSVQISSKIANVFSILWHKLRIMPSDIENHFTFIFICTMSLTVTRGKVTITGIIDIAQVDSH